MGEAENTANSAPTTLLTFLMHSWLSSWRCKRMTDMLLPGEWAVLKAQKCFEKLKTGAPSMITFHSW